MLEYATLVESPHALPDNLILVFQQPISYRIVEHIERRICPPELGRHEFFFAYSFFLPKKKNNCQGFCVQGAGRSETVKTNNLFILL